MVDLEESISSMMISTNAAAEPVEKAIPCPSIPPITYTPRFCPGISPTQGRPSDENPMMPVHSDFAFSSLRCFDGEVGWEDVVHLRGGEPIARETCSQRSSGSDPDEGGEVEAVEGGDLGVERDVRVDVEKPVSLAKHSPITERR